jgi:uncharacterized protein YraI
LDGKFICLPDSLGVQVAAIELSHQGLGNIGGFDVPVQDSAFHFLDYNPFTSGDEVSSYFMYIIVYVMKQIWFKFLETMLIGFAVSLVALSAPGQVWAHGEAQAQSGVVATVTYSEPINVRGGPSTVYYPIVGRVSPGDVLPALGVSPGREWVQVSYPEAPGGVGWLYAAYVTISGGELKIVEPPPTQTPVATATINPTFAAAFFFQPTATRIPTFTPPPPLTIPQFTDGEALRPAGLAPGTIAVSLFAIAILVFLISFALNRR